MFSNTSASSSSDVVVRLSQLEYNEPLKYSNWERYKDIDKYRPVGPRFADGSINWQCPCMSGGSLVAHRCGHLFRELYVCMKSDDKKDPSTTCPHQFVDWAACMQNMSDERREFMRKAMTSDKEEIGIKN